MKTNCTTRYAVHPSDFKTYDSDRIQKEFKVENILIKDEVNWVYSLYDRFMVGGAVPASEALSLEPVDPLKADYFLERRELGIINVGGAGTVTADGQSYTLAHKEALYLGRGTKKVFFKSESDLEPALFYLNSAPAHQTHPNQLIRIADANKLHLGSLKTSNERTIHQLLVKEIVTTCQLQMGMTELQPGSVWNTMPAHTHERRMECYFYFEVPEGQAICHFMGQPQETRHLFLKNFEAVLSPSWSIHSAAGTSNYIFIWGMAGENLDYTDMDHATPDQLT